MRVTSVLPSIQHQGLSPSQSIKESTLCPDGRPGMEHGEMRSCLKITSWPSCKQLILALRKVGELVLDWPKVNNIEYKDPNAQLSLWGLGYHQTTQGTTWQNICLTGTSVHSVYHRGAWPAALTTEIMAPKWQPATKRAGRELVRGQLVIFYWTLRQIPDAQS